MSMHIEVGTQVIGQSGSKGVICAVLEPATRSFIIGAGMSQVMKEYEIAWQYGRVETLPDGIVRPFVERAAHLPKIDDVETFKAEMLAKQAETRAAALKSGEEARAKQLAFRAEAKERTPSWAKAVICAELVADRSDIMSDYHGSTTVRTVILGFSPHARDLFPELRKFAATFPETAFLADAPASAEHREKYSMGAGYYLKQGYRDSDGWRLKKYKLYDKGADFVPAGEWHIAEPVANTDEPAAVAVSGMVIEKHVHTKRGFDMWICIMPGRVERAEYDRLLDAAKALGGWYSAKWGTTPAGFAFKSEALAQQFANGQAAGAAPESLEAIAKPVTNSNVAEKFRAAADKMQGDIDHKLADRQTNTPKRQREAASARIEGWHLQRTQSALRKLAEMHESGTVPPILSGLKSKADVHALTASKIDRSNAGYYDAGIDTNKPAVPGEKAAAVWALLQAKSVEESRKEELRDKVSRLQFSKIPGYFPTPASVIAQMIEAADLPNDSCRVLEPEAGSGAIIRAVRDHAPQASIEAYERHASLREILKLQNVDLAGSDFMEAVPAPAFDYVLMNPPFENGQDIEHVCHAFRFLKPGGTLVAIMSPGPFFRSDRKAQAFRDWFDNRGGEKVDIPAGAFKESGTGIATVMVTLKA